MKVDPAVRQVVAALPTFGETLAGALGGWAMHAVAYRLSHHLHADSLAQRAGRLAHRLDAKGEAAQVRLDELTS